MRVHQAKAQGTANTEAGPPTLPDEFWQQAEIQHAARSRNFGYLLKAYRDLQSPLVRQSQLARWLGLSQGQVSRIERGSSNTHDLEKLAKWARLLHIPRHVVWFDLTAQVEHASEEEPDVDRRQLLKSVGVGAVLLGTEASDAAGRVLTASPSRVIGTKDVDSLKYWTQAFRQADNRFGGGESLQQAVAFIKNRVAPLLSTSRGSSKVRADLFAGAAELFQLVGWMSYDIGDQAAGRRFLHQALQLAREAVDRALAAEMLLGMSHQAAFFNAPDEALDLAMAARQLAEPTGIAALVAEAAAMEAHAHALRQDASASMRALRHAETNFCRMRSNDAPTWLVYFDQAYLSAKFAHTLRELGQASDAEQFARQSLQMTEGYDRGRVFNTALLAGTLADQGKVDEAVAYTTEALDLTISVRSTRTTAYMTDVAVRLSPFSQQPVVRRVYKRMTAQRIPLRRVA
ncbi:helix-turn-helix domain-containing protein [Actinopolymorpha singaporensis]|uniref:Helix-turn-helix domain-containing protein n=1 Tax=Actinopolymorpha singaporensis TaxID=117157 RepID=A0A1H1PAV9_9ACTN|nr:helix-turn-helix domain-containing protein [Actinopolymorpha singaporensis]SDS08283.1 Helix-turn-helix domain-containing protein [Actinopolymorpha singaporensis]